MIVDKIIEDQRECNVCGKTFDYDNGMLNILEILECSDARIQEWQKKNPNIMLEDWFCMDCVNKHITQIETKERISK